MLVIETEGVVRGKLAAAGKLRLQCWLEGDIVCSRLDIGPDGYILGNVTARELYVEGQIVGKVEASVVHLMEGALVEGDILHSVISIHPTASLLGRAIRTRGFAPAELLALEAKSTAPCRDLAQDRRGGARIPGVDWTNYQVTRSITPFRTPPA